MSSHSSRMSNILGRKTAQRSAKRGERQALRHNQADAQNISVGLRSIARMPRARLLILQ